MSTTSDTMRILFKLGVVSLLMWEKDSKRLVDGSFFSDLRLTLMSRLTQMVLASYDTLPFRDDKELHQPQAQFRTWLEVQVNVYDQADAYVQVGFEHILSVPYYRVEDIGVFYGMTPDQVIRVTQGLYGFDVYPLSFGVVVCGGDLASVGQMVVDALFLHTRQINKGKTMSIFGGK